MYVLLQCPDINNHIPAPTPGLLLPSGQEQIGNIALLLQQRYTAMPSDKQFPRTGRLPVQKNALATLRDEPME